MDTKVAYMTHISQIFKTIHKSSLANNFNNVWENQKLFVTSLLIFKGNNLMMMLPWCIGVNSDKFRASGLHQREESLCRSSTILSLSFLRRHLWIFSMINSDKFCHFQGWLLWPYDVCRQRQNNLLGILALVSSSFLSAFLMQIICGLHLVCNVHFVKESTEKDASATMWEKRHDITADFSILPVVYYWNTTDITGKNSDLQCSVEQGGQKKRKRCVLVLAHEFYLC